MAFLLYTIDKFTLLGYHMDILTTLNNNLLKVDLALEVRDLANPQPRGNMIRMPEIATTTELGKPLPMTHEEILIPFEVWESIAYDIALGDASMATIAEGYDVTLEQLDLLVANENFSKILDTKVKEVEQLGTEAAFAIKFRMIANKAASEFMRRLVDKSAKDKDFVAMYKTAVEYAQLAPKDDKDDPTPSMFGPNITYNINGVPGLDHLNLAPSIVDGDFKEVVDG